MNPCGLFNPVGWRVDRKKYHRRFLALVRVFKTTSILLKTSRWHARRLLFFKMIYRTSHFGYRRIIRALDHDFTKQRLLCCTTCRWYTRTLLLFKMLADNPVLRTGALSPPLIMTSRNNVYFAARLADGTPRTLLLFFKCFSGQACFENRHIIFALW